MPSSLRFMSVDPRMDVGSTGRCGFDRASSVGLCADGRERNTHSADGGPCRGFDDRCQGKAPTAHGEPPDGRPPVMETAWAMATGTAPSGLDIVLLNLAHELVHVGTWSWDVRTD